MDPFYRYGISWYVRMYYTLPTCSNAIVLSHSIVDDYWQMAICFSFLLLLVRSTKLRLRTGKYWRSSSPKTMRYRSWKRYSTICSTVLYLSVFIKCLVGLCDINGGWSFIQVWNKLTEHFIRNICLFMHSSNQLIMWQHAVHKIMQIQLRSFS